ncbi:MAG: sodium:calcium antiporter [Actinomycetota bacterium]
MDSLGTPVLLAILLGAGVLTWVAGLSLSKATDVIDDHFDLGQAIGGVILLGIAGTLPELAITVSAALSGALGLATGNLLGGIAMQTLVLVLLDATSRRKRPLTYLSDTLEPLHEGALVVGVVAIAIMGALLPKSASIGPMSPASIAIVVVWLLGIVTLNRSRTSQRWKAVSGRGDGTTGAEPAASETTTASNPMASSPIGRVIAIFSVAAVATLVAGVLLEQSGNALASRFGINGVIFGATVLALITALPEISTGVAAVRMGEVGLAMGDIFGGNAIQVTLFLVADLLAGKPVLPEASAQSGWLAALGIVVTAIYLNGLMTRPSQKFLGVVGPDSAMVTIAYALGVAGLVYVT